MVALGRLNRLSTKSMRRLLLVTNAALIAGTALLLAWAVSPPPAATVPLPSKRNTSQPKAAMDKRETKPLSYYMAAADVPLRKPFVEPPPPAPAPQAEPTPQLPPLRMRLVGILEDPDAAYGVFVTSAGQEVLATIGETVDDAELLSVNGESVTMKYRGEHVDLKLPEREDIGASEPGGEPPHPSQAGPQRPVTREPAGRRVIRRRVIRREPEEFSR